MSLKERTINVDIMTKEYTKLKYKQGDSNQTLKFKFYKNGSELDLTGYVAGIFYEKPNNEVLEKTGNISANTVTTTITSGVLNTAGTVKTEIFLTKNDEVSISFTIVIEVEASIDKNGAVQEKEEWDAIKDLLNSSNNVSIIDDTATATNKTWSSSKIENDMKNIGKPTDEQVASVINEAIANGDIIAGSLTNTAQTLLISILRNAVYTSDQSESITLLTSALKSSGSGGGGSTTQYTITNNLSNATSSNSSIIIDANTSYTTTITADSGYILDAITVTMGGTDVTSSVVSGNTITISSVTGDVVITVTTNSSSGSGEETTTYTYNLADIATAIHENTNAFEAGYYDAGNSDAGGYGNNSGYTTYVINNIKAGDVITYANNKNLTGSNIQKTIVYISGTTVSSINFTNVNTDFLDNYSWRLNSITVGQDYDTVYVEIYPNGVENAIAHVPTLITNTSR